MRARSGEWGWRLVVVRGEQGGCGGKRRVKVEGEPTGGGLKERCDVLGKGGGGGLFTHCSDSQALPMKNAWNISQKHNFLHGSEERSGACSPP